MGRSRASTTRLPLLLYLLLIHGFCHSEPSAAFSCTHPGSSSRSTAFMGKNPAIETGGGRSIPLAASSTSSQATARIPTDGIHLRDGRYVRLGWMRRHWAENVAIALLGGLLTLLRRRFLSMPMTKAPLNAVAKTLRLFFGVGEYFLYALSLYQIYLDVFKRPTLLPADELALEDSIFVQVNALTVHALIRSGSSSSPERIVHFNHGFGASSFSFDPILSRLSGSLNATTIAHDCPGFGLTGEPPLGVHGDLLYSFEHNAQLGKAMVDLERKSASGRPQLVYAGHSMGSITSSFQALEHLATHSNCTSVLILIAPAILAMDSPLTLAPKGRSSVMISRLFRSIWKAGLRNASLASLRFLLRSIVYMNDFWQNGLGQAWGPRRKPCTETIQRYRRPSLKRGWDRSLARFVVAPVSAWMMPPADDESGRRSKAMGDVIKSVAARSKEGRLKVLIVHGKHDAIIPSSNSRRLAKMIPGSKLMEMDCGHVPHEEHPNEFAEHIEAFFRE